MLKRKPKILSTEFLTTKRHELFTIAQLLAESIPSLLLCKPDRPINIYVTGHDSSGKKIFPDAIRQFLFTQQRPEFAGKREYDERWTDNRKKLDIRFINTAWMSWEGNKYSDHLAKAKDQNELMERFFGDRKYGGINFIHNDTIAADTADIHIELCHTDPKDNCRLMDMFAHKNQIPLEGIWLRKITIQVRDPRLINDPDFRLGFDALTPKKERQSTPIYGRHLPKTRLI